MYVHAGGLPIMICYSMVSGKYYVQISALSAYLYISPQELSVKFDARGLATADKA
jgi:hypothetical protein